MFFSYTASNTLLRSVWSKLYSLRIFSLNGFSLDLLLSDSSPLLSVCLFEVGLFYRSADLGATDCLDLSDFGVVVMFFFFFSLCLLLCSLFLIDFKSSLVFSWFKSTMMSLTIFFKLLQLLSLVNLSFLFFSWVYAFNGVLALLSDPYSMSTYFLFLSDLEFDLDWFTFSTSGWILLLDPCIVFSVCLFGSLWLDFSVSLLESFSLAVLVSPLLLSLTFPFFYTLLTLSSFNLNLSLSTWIALVNSTSGMFSMPCWIRYF